MDPLERLVFDHAQDLQAAAASYRLARSCRHRPGLPLRLYSRLWWASRPRAATWAPALLDTPPRCA